jgi:hypothetical protein
VLLTRYSSGDQTTGNEMGKGKFDVLGERRLAYRLLVDKSEALRPIGRPRH